MILQEPCPKVEALSALTDGALDGAERTALEAHVAGCVLCAPVLADFSQLRSRFASLPEVTLRVDVAAEVDRRIRALGLPARPQVAPAPRRRWWQIALLAPGGAAAVTAGLWLGAAMMPASAGAPAAQMAAFSAAPPGTICPVAKACAGIAR